MMTANEKTGFIDGERIFLREVRIEDVNDSYYGWLNDQTVTKFTESRFLPQSLDQIREYVRAAQGNRNCVFLAIVEKSSGKHIGNLKLDPIYWVHRLAEVGIIIGDKSCWGRGYATEALKLAAGYARSRLNLHKLCAGFYADNVGSILAFTRAGFIEEGRFAQHWYSDGRYVDGIRVGLILEEHR